VCVGSTASGLPLELVGSEVFELEPELDFELVVGAALELVVESLNELASGKGAVVSGRSVSSGPDSAVGIAVSDIVTVAVTVLMLEMVATEVVIPALLLEDEASASLALSPIFRATFGKYQ
jgi:hypothetical protein